MASIVPWPLAVCVFPEPDPNRPRTVQYPNYVHEILAHAGVCYASVALADLPATLDRTRLLVTVGEAQLPDDLKSRLREWVAAGGGWLALGGTCGMDDVLGVAQGAPYQGFGAGARTLGEGYLVAQAKDHPSVAHLEKPLHFFNGFAMAPKGATVLAKALDKHGRAKDEPVLFEQSHGRGRCLTCAVDVTGTVVLVQQGFAVTRDGIPAGDGSAPVTDGVLKSGDGGVLDWIFDRDEVPGKPGFLAYLKPVADLWRELLLRSIFHLADTQKVALPVLWYWPRNLPAIAHMSHDTDGNDRANGVRLLELCKEAGINTTWCTILPGYGPDVMNAIRAAGHEFATHYDAMTPGLDFCQEQVDRQFHDLKALFGNEQPVSNKNHYLRWEGDVEFFDWIAKCGIQLDQSKGASKTGEAGFNFGTCHTYFPVRFNGQVIDVLEMATTTQDLNVFADEALLDPLLDAAVKHHGILHLLFHPAHVLKEPVANALLRSARDAKSRGLEWWTASAINRWERSRRQVKWTSDARGITLRTGPALPDATLMCLGPSGQTFGVGGVGVQSQTVTRWGFTFHAVTATLDGETDHTLVL